MLPPKSPTQPIDVKIVNTSTKPVPVIENKISYNFTWQQGPEYPSPIDNQPVNVPSGKKFVIEVINVTCGVYPSPEIRYMAFKLMSDAHIDNNGNLSGVIYEFLLTPIRFGVDGGVRQFLSHTTKIVTQGNVLFSLYLINILDHMIDPNINTVSHVNITLSGYLTD